MTTPSDHPTPDQPPTDPGTPTVVTPVDPTTGYAVPDAGAPAPDPTAGTAGPDPATDTAPTPTWGAAAPPPAPPGPAVPPVTPSGGGSGRGWYRQPWGVAAIVVGGLAALTLSFVAGFATRTVIDRAVVFDRVADRSIDGDRGYGPGMGGRDGDRGMGRDAYGDGMGPHGDGTGQQGQRMPGHGPQDGTGPMVPPQAPAPQDPPPAAPAPQPSS